MVTIQPIHVKQAWPIRHTVMDPEKDNRSSLPKDELGNHFGLFENDELVSVASVYREGNSMQFRKFGTVEEKQGMGYGKRLLNYIIDYSKSAGVKKIWFNARKNTYAFYQALGFHETGNTFKKDDDDYVVVERDI